MELMKLDHQLDDLAAILSGIARHRPCPPLQIVREILTGRFPVSATMGDEEDEAMRRVESPQRVSRIRLALAAMVPADRREGPRARRAMQKAA
jgi:hypothetical protein